MSNNRPIQHYGLALESKDKHWMSQTWPREQTGSGYTLPDNDSRAQIKIPLHNVQQLSLTFVGGSIMEDGDGQWVGNTNSVGHLMHKVCVLKIYKSALKILKKPTSSYSCTHASLPHLHTWTSTLLQRPAFTRDFATQRAAYAADRSTLV